MSVKNQNLDQTQNSEKNIKIWINIENLGHNQNLDQK